MPTANGKDSMFIPDDKGFDYDSFTENCQKQYGLTPRLSFIFDYFGGKDIKRDFYDTTNIIFTNGNLDPWSAGSITKNITVGWGCNALYM